ncbi:MAG: hypothetical protein ACREJ2_18280 [Planctomycetota bacterium]
MSSWSVLPFFDHEQPLPDGTMHSKMWTHVLDRLKRDWKVSDLSVIADAYTALPRGRVAVPRDGGFCVYHGDNNPPGTDMQAVLEAFQLTLGPRCRLVVDEHETVLTDDLRRLERALAFKFPLKTLTRMFDDE